MAKYIVIALLAGLLQSGLAGCSAESENYSSKDMLEAMLVSSQWQIQLQDETTGRTKTPSGYYMVFDGRQGVKLFNGLSYEGTWELRFANEIIFHDDFIAAPPDYEQQLVFDEVEEEYLYLLLNFYSLPGSALTRHWQVKGFACEWVKLQHYYSGQLLMLWRIEEPINQQ